MCLVVPNIDRKLTRSVEGAKAEFHPPPKSSFDAAFCNSKPSINYYTMTPGLNCKND